MDRWILKIIARLRKHRRKVAQQRVAREVARRKQVLENNPSYRAYQAIINQLNPPRCAGRLGPGA